jgi:tetratricopeptide (TPR) repeat protein
LSQYICQTPSCALALSKASFPMAMNCPVCQTPLEEKSDIINLSPDDVALINSLPYVIAYPLKRTLLEKHPWTKINLLKDTFLNFLKYIGLITASEFFNSPLKDKKMVALFHSALAEPSFGSWNQYIRETLSYLKENNHSFFCSDLLSYYDLIESGKKRKLFKGEIEIIDANGDIQLKKQEATAIGMLINFRNRYLGHGLTLDEIDAVNHWEMYFPIFRELLAQMKFSEAYPMFKCEHGETFLLKSAEISLVEKGNQTSARVWIENPEGNSMDILPFFVVPGEVSLAKQDKEQLLTYESYTGKTIKFFSPEGTEKQTSGKILEKLNLLLRDKQKETPFRPEAFTKDEFLKRIAEENKLLLDTLISEKKIIPGVYQHREEMEIKLSEWIGARANIFFIMAEAGSGKTNLLVEIQKQYTERDLPSLLIRAGRMEKQTLKEQITYLLNIDLEKGLEKYASIAGTQAEPTFILIDGLNEANNAEEIWQEVIELCKLFVPGSLKFVVTNRANTKAELNRYLVSEKEQELLYGENKDNETGLGAYSFWLTALDMQEMKGAWDTYVVKDKVRFKPQFSFDAIAGFDRGIYNQINNPLILRLFLEIYNGKVLPKKGVKHLNIWHNWLKTFSTEEQLFLKLVANEVWQKGENELLLDDLLKNKILKPYLAADIINAPYNRLKNNGWISRYVKDLNGYISFTVEGTLLFLLALQLYEQKPAIDLAFIQALLKSGSKLQKSVIETFLCEHALNGDLNLVAELIDVGNEDIDLCIKPLLLYLKTIGVKVFLEKVLENPTENDWKALNELDDQLAELQLHVLRKEYLIALMPQNEFKTKDSLGLGLKAIAIFDKEEAINYLNKVDTNASFIVEDDDLLSELGNCEYKFGNYDKAREYYEKCLAIALKNFGVEDIIVAFYYSQIGKTWISKGECDKALEFFEKCLAIQLKTFGAEGNSDENFLVAFSNLEIGRTWSSKGEISKAFGEISNSLIEFEKGLEYCQKGLAILLKIFGEEHPQVANAYNNIAIIWSSKGEHDKALEYFKKNLAIQLKIFGEEHPDVAIMYSNIGNIWKSKANFDKALEYFEKCLAIQLKTLGGEHINVVFTYFIIGETWNQKGEHDKALEFFEKCLAITLKTMGDEYPTIALIYDNIGNIWDSRGEDYKALEYFEKCLVIRIKTFGQEHDITTSLSVKILNILLKKGEYDKVIEILAGDIILHPAVVQLYNFFGNNCYSKGEYDKSLEFYEKSLVIQLKTFGEEHPDVARSYFDIGNCNYELKLYSIAIDFFKKGFSTEKKGGYLFQIGKCYEALDNSELALDYYIQSAEIRKEDSEVGINDESTKTSIESAKHLAKELGKENDLPEWMKEIN